MTNPESSLPPGFRFHPTDEELILHYLKNRAMSESIQVSIIAEVDIYKYDPWDLPAKAKFGDREWYFFSPRDRKYPNGVRPNRAAASGYWKATGTDKPIITSSGGYETIGVKKALVFYSGKPPRGDKTDWIMHEYRLSGSPNSSNKIHHHIHMKNKNTSSMRLDDWVLCRIYKKNNTQNTIIQSCEKELRDCSNLEESYLSTLPNLAQQTSNNNFKIPKTNSLTESLEDNNYTMLNRFLFDNPTDISTQQQQQQMDCSFFNIPTNNFQNNSQAPATYSSSSNNLKRPRAEDDYFETESSSGVVAGSGDLHHPLRSFHNSSLNSSVNFSNQMMGLPQYNSNIYNHQLSLNSHLGLR